MGLTLLENVALMPERKKFSSYRANVALGPQTQDLLNEIKAGTTWDLSIMARSALWLWMMAGRAVQQDTIAQGLAGRDPLADPEDADQLAKAAVVFEHAAQQCRARLSEKQRLNRNSRPDKR